MHLASSDGKVQTAETVDIFHYFHIRTIAGIALRNLMVRERNLK